MNLSVYWWYNSKDDESPCGTRMGGNVGFDGELFDGEILLLTNDTSQADPLSNSVYHVRIESFSSANYREIPTEKPILWNDTRVEIKNTVQLESFPDFNRTIRFPSATQNARIKEDTWNWKRIACAGTTQSLLRLQRRRAHDAF